MHLRLIGTLFILLLLPFAVKAQLNRLREKNLDHIKDSADNLSKQEWNRVQKYAKSHQLPLKFTDSKGNNAYLMGIDSYGMPIYYTTLNEGAALTTGVTKLRAGSTTGFNLQGSGITVGVWDEALIKNHVEFDNRILSKQGTELSRHSTHVTGTIIASGINSAAKGMAPKAQITAWDFNNDLAEMATLAKSDQSSILFSNHSYSTLLGFYRNGSGWSWAGNEMVSKDEDYRFGFYNPKSYYLDYIAYNAPYYTIVWAAGNERTDVGDGTHHQDGNNGTGYDCINPEGSSKNVITVGAVQKVTNYVDPTSVVMSDFSSWGPTDDGRIKPDLVAAGVSVYSTGVTAAGADTYLTLQGTSMAAPNVTGSLALLQELYRNTHGGNYMRAATLKALAIHHAKEAGINPGPDYKFGWGLLDVESAALTLIKEGTTGVRVQESTLENGTTYFESFNPQPNTKVKVTLVWTDPPGNVPEPKVDPIDLILVNDLDIRLVDESGNEAFPWTLNPTSPSAAAQRGDNVRDNVEKIEFTIPDDQTYRVRINHKGTLQEGFQDFSFVLTYTPKVADAATLYWIGNSGNWNDPLHWSLSSGGPTANITPSTSNPVVIDENSFSTTGKSISLTGNGSCSLIKWISTKQASLSLNNNTLQVEKDLIVGTKQFSISTPGMVSLTGDLPEEYNISLNQNDLSKLSLIVAGSSSWKINAVGGESSIGEIRLLNGNLIASHVQLNVNRLFAFEGTLPRTLDFSFSTINQLKETDLDAEVLNLITTTETTIGLKNNASLDWKKIQYNGALSTSSGVTALTGGFEISNTILAGQVEVDGNNVFNELAIMPGAQVFFHSGTQQLTSLFAINGELNNRVVLIGEASTIFSFDGHFKKCFDYVDVNQINLAGEVTINVGENGTLQNAAGWSIGSCASALFANFEVDYTCVASFSDFLDTSEGSIVSWDWDFGDPASADNHSQLQHPNHLFEEAKVYTVTLTVADGSTSQSFTKEVLIKENSLPANEIMIANGNKLFSKNLATAYQWFKNDEELIGETGRYYDYNGDVGIYKVITHNEQCNFVSPSYLVTATEEIKNNVRINVFPNPADQEFTLVVPVTLIPAHIEMVDQVGRVIRKEVLNGERTTFNSEGLPAGLYVIRTNTSLPSHRVMIQH